MDNDQALPADANGIVLAGGIDSTDASKVLPLEINPANGGVVVDWE